MAKSKDPVEIAHGIFDEFLSRHDPESVTEKPPEAKDPKRQAAGRKGGLKGGQVRVLRLSAKKRKAIAQKAAKTRWNKTTDKE
jgi:hypothetical protein